MLVSVILFCYIWCQIKLLVNMRPDYSAWIRISPAGFRRGIVSRVHCPCVRRGADTDGKPPPVFPHRPPPCGWSETVSVQRLCQSPRSQCHVWWRLLPALALEPRGIIQNAVCNIAADSAEGAYWIYSKFTWVWFSRCGWLFRVLVTTLSLDCWICFPSWVLLHFCFNLDLLSLWSRGRKFLLLAKCYFFFMFRIRNKFSLSECS